MRFLRIYTQLAQLFFKNLLSILKLTGSRYGRFERVTTIRGEVNFVPEEEENKEIVQYPFNRSISKQDF